MDRLPPGELLVLTGGCLSSRGGKIWVAQGLLAWHSCLWRGGREDSGTLENRGRNLRSARALILTGAPRVVAGFGARLGATCAPQPPGTWKLLHYRGCNARGSAAQPSCCDCRHSCEEEIGQAVCASSRFAADATAAERTRHRLNLVSLNGQVLQC